MSRLNVEDALRIAQIFEADDIISVPAMVCRVMRHEILQLRQQIETGRLQELATQVKT